MKEEKGKKQKIKLPEPKAGFKVLSVFLCIIMFPVMLYLYFGSQINFYLSSAGINMFLEQSGYIEESLDDFLYEAFYIDEASYYMSEEQLQECRDLYVTTMQNAVQVCFTGEGDVVDVEAFMNFAKSNRKLLEAAYEYELEPEDYEYMQEDLEYLNEYMTEYYADELLYYFDEPAGTIVKNLKNIVALTYLLLAAAYIIFVFVLMLILFGKRQDKAFIYMSVPAIVSGFFMLLFSGFLKALAVLSESGDGLLDIYLEDTMISSANLIANNAFIIAVIVLAAGIAFNIIGHVIRCRKKKELALVENADSSV